MPVTVKQLPQQPVIVLTVSEPFDAVEETPTAAVRFQELAAAIQGPVYRIIDVDQWDIPFGDLVAVLSLDANGGVKADPRIRTVVVGASELLALGMQAMKQQPSGTAQTLIFPAMGEALTAVKAEIARAAVGK